MRITKKRIAGVIGVIIALMLLRYFTSPATRIVFGCVLDAVTHRPGRIVRIEAVLDGYFSGIFVVTESQAYLCCCFILLLGFRWMPGGPLSNFRSDFVTVNEDTKNSTGESSAEGTVVYNPMF